jgi:hypothetical protein
MGRRGGEFKIQNSKFKMQNQLICLVGVLEAAKE